MNNKIKVSLYILICLILISSMGILIIRNNKPEKANLINIDSIKTFKDDKYGFEFDIPKGFIITKALPNEVQISNSDISFYISVNPTVSFSGWDQYKTYNVTGTDNNAIVSIGSKVLNEEERVGSQLNTTPYVFIADIKTTDKNFYMVTSSWLEKEQIDNPEIEKEFVGLVRSFKKTR